MERFAQNILGNHGVEEILNSPPMECVSPASTEDTSYFISVEADTEPLGAEEVWSSLGDVSPWCMVLSKATIKTHGAPVRINDITEPEVDLNDVIAYIYMDTVNIDVEVMLPSLEFEAVQTDFTTTCIPSNIPSNIPSEKGDANNPDCALGNLPSLPTYPSSKRQQVLTLQAKLPHSVKKGEKKRRRPGRPARTESVSRGPKEARAIILVLFIGYLCQDVLTNSRTKVSKGSNWKSKILLDPEADGNGSTPAEEIADKDIRIRMNEYKNNMIHTIWMYKIPLSEFWQWRWMPGPFYHAYVVLQTDNYWWSIEKNTEGIQLQRAKSKEAVVKKINQKLRCTTDYWREPEVVKYGPAYITMTDLVQTIYERDLIDKTYHVAISNCQGFAEEIYQRALGES